MRSSLKLYRVLRIFAILTTLISTVGCDQLSKNIVRQRVEYNEQIDLVGKYFIITKIENGGAFLSIGDSLAQPIKFLLLTILPVIVLGLVFIFVLARRDSTNLTTLGACLVTGGGIGNIYDRFTYGTVTDFLHIDAVLFQTGIFNLADVSIMVGLFIVLAEGYFNLGNSDMWRTNKQEGPKI